MPKKSDPAGCIVHLAWKPCLGRHQSHDPEVCWITRKPAATAIIRSVHNGTISAAVARQRLEEMRKEIKPRKVYEIVECV